MYFCIMIVTLVNVLSEITKEGGEDVEVVRTEEWTTMCVTIVGNLDTTREIAELQGGEGGGKDGEREEAKERSPGRTGEKRSAPHD
ncbi:hypothetical protein GBF38_016613 [Nibea albiflora]|uniref:Uncharacterized protein n=1 Tax=Nibea albiflora TaxID=240163 RepID=A0ACB7ESU9_NIBAL|nr:hypothetical protein GBF38_016613 [Nibea albiflora]